ncbi:hypothetical protein H6F97_22295 [Microcoleus sp. FACHB-1]|nr:hypothetical protein [Microcoleus sp. FACHB-1]
MGACTKKSLSVARRLLPTTEGKPSALYLLPSALYLLPSALYLLPSALYLLPSAFCPLPSAFCPLPSAFCLLPSTFCFLPSTFCLLPFFGQGQLGKFLLLELFLLPHLVVDSQDTP